MKKFEWKKVMQNIGKGKRKIIAVTVVICLVAVTAGNAISKQGKTKAENNSVISTAVKTGTIQESVKGTGTISYASTTDIEVPSDLEIDEVLITEGTYVEQGTMLATVDETSLAVCIADVQEDISSLDNTITSELSSTTTKYITAGVSGTVEKIYGKVGDSIADTMVEYGALMLVKNGEETIKIVGSDGTITAVNVSEGGTVSSSTKVFTLESDAQSGEYLQAVMDREELVTVMETLISIKKNGGITASVEGMVEAINVSDSSSGNASSGSSSSGGSSSGVSEAYKSLDVAEQENAKERAILHNITAVKMSCLSMGDNSNSGTIVASASAMGESEDYGVSDEKAEVLRSLKAGAGRIEGTTKDMEYAEKEDAEKWTQCLDDYTEVAAGTWYVRYKATDTEAASDAVEIEITDTAENSLSYESANGGNNSGTVNSENDNKSSSAGKTTDSTVSKTSSGTDNNAGSSSSTNSSSKSSDDAGQGSTSSNSKSGESTSGKSSGLSSGTSGSKSSSSGSGSAGSSSSGSSSSSKASFSTISAFTIANGDKMKVTMNVDELDILTMEEGLTANISLDAVENKIFEGTITNVSGSASGSNGTAQYPVEITFDRTEEMLSGMNASVEVIISEAKDVLTISLAAVSDEGRESYVYTGYDESSGELTGKTEVTLGMSDENSVEIKDGLSEGDIIYYEMKSSESSDNKSGKNGMGGMGMPGMNGSGDMKMGGSRPSGGNGGERSSGGNGGDRPTGGNSQGRSKSN